MSETGVARGLEGVVVDDSAICHIDGDRGELLYRGYSIADLAGVCGFEEVAHLLWHGELPARAQLAVTGDALRAARRLEPGLLDHLRALPRSASPMDVVRTVVSLHGSYDRGRDDGELGRAVRLTGALAVAIPAFHRIRERLPVLEQRPDLDHAGNILWCLLGEVPPAAAVRAFDTALVLHMEHGFNASTFAARVTASTMADLHGAVTSAVATLKGPLHGGANERVMAMLLEIGSVERAESWVRERIAARAKIMGFGHRVYKTADPRALVLRRLAEEQAQGDEETQRLVAISTVIEREVERALGDRGIAPNVDFYSATLYHALGIPRDIFTPVFALSRVVGWTAHILEQHTNNRLIRPTSRYTGPARRPLVPLASR